MTAPKESGHGDPFDPATRWVCPPCRRGEHVDTYHLSDRPDVTVCHCATCIAQGGQMTTTDPLDLADVAWQFNEAVSLLRSAGRCARFGTGDTELADEIDDGLPAMQRALEHAASRVVGYERTRRMFEFVTTLADRGEIKVNGIPWREAFDRLNEIVSDPV